jgi:hypothetical protein
MTGHHLTDEEFTELLSGDCPLDASRHLQACAQCQWEFKQVQASIKDFGACSFAWAEEHASAPIPAPSALARVWQPRSTWSAAAAVLAAAVLFGIHQEMSTRAPVVLQADAVHPAHSEQDVSEDNRLMMAIDREIHWQEESPLAIDHMGSGRRPVSEAAGRLAN